MSEPEQPTPTEPTKAEVCTPFPSRTIQVQIGPVTARCRADVDAKITGTEFDPQILARLMGEVLKVSAALSASALNLLIIGIQKEVDPMQILSRAMELTFDLTKRMVGAAKSIEETGGVEPILAVAQEVPADVK